MKKVKKNLALFALATIALMGVTSCAEGAPEQLGLKDAFEGKFYIGTALNEPQILGIDTAAIKVVKENFNSIVAENVMKSGPMQPTEGNFNFEMADKFVEFGVQNNMHIVGHTLIWHSQAPRWFFTDEEGNDVSAEVLKEDRKSVV